MLSNTRIVYVHFNDTFNQQLVSKFMHLFSSSNSNSTSNKLIFVYIVGCESWLFVIFYLNARREKDIYLSTRESKHDWLLFVIIEGIQFGEN